ncbi:hypothetical protein KAR91_16760 [Candidatus Pacearchaeota archaeon]|nr:hypothetical protein [Candidatus Pacearchaeota archaeon]
MSADKRCSKCKILKGISGFHKDKLKRDGRNSICKKCRNDEAEQEKASEIKIPDSKCRCNRTKTLISKLSCVPGCNDACMTCENPQTQNIKAGDTLTSEEHREQTLSGTYRSSALIAVED